MTFSIRIDGRESVDHALDELTKPKIDRALTKAARASALVFRTEMKAEARRVVKKKTGRLFRSINFRSLRPEEGVGAIVGPRVAADPAKRAPHAHLIEAGHRMVTHRPAKSQIGFVAARPFVEPTFERAEAEATAAFDKAIDAILDKL